MISGTLFDQSYSHKKARNILYAPGLCASSDVLRLVAGYFSVLRRFLSTVCKIPPFR